MEDSNKNAKTEKQIEEQNDLNKVATGSIVINAPKVAPKRIRVSVKTKPAPTNLSEIAPKSIAEVIEPPKASKPAIKKEKKPEEKIVIKKAPTKEKTKPEAIVQNVVLANSKEEQEKPDLGNDTKKVIKKKTKKAEEKVDKLKKKVKKAKKKDVKKSKLKGLKEKLGKALKKFKTIVEKLKVEDK